MTYKLTIEQKPGYMHLAVTGRNSSENVVRYMEEVIRPAASRPYSASALIGRLMSERTASRAGRCW